MTREESRSGNEPGPAYQPYALLLALGERQRHREYRERGRNERDREIFHSKLIPTGRGGEQSSSECGDRDQGDDDVSPFFLLFFFFLGGVGSGGGGGGGGGAGG